MKCLMRKPVCMHFICFELTDNVQCIALRIVLQLCIITYNYLRYRSRMQYFSKCKLISIL